jgi:hypothetical protein
MTPPTMDELRARRQLRPASGQVENIVPQAPRELYSGRPDRNMNDMARRVALLHELGAAADRVKLASTAAKRGLAIAETVGWIATDVADSVPPIEMADNLVTLAALALAWLETIDDELGSAA